MSEQRERRASNLTLLCDIVGPFLMDDPALLKAFRKRLKHWARENKAGKYLRPWDRDEAYERQRHALEVVTGTTLMRIGFPSEPPF